MTSHAPSVEQTLAGGDRRSIGHVQRVVAHALRDRRVAQELVVALGSRDPLVALRAADALEKISASRPEWLAPTRARLFRSAVATTDPVVRWNLIQLLSRLEHAPRQAVSFARRLETWFHTDPSAVVQVSALDAMVTLAAAHAGLQSRAQHMLAEAQTSPSAAVRARARKLERGKPALVSQLESVRNIGAVTARWLRAVGIDTVAELRRVGPAEAYMRVQFRVGRAANRNWLYAIATGLQNRAYNSLSPAEKRRLHDAAGITDGPRKRKPSPRSHGG